jgi:4-hydroxy-3-methylbut-2-en-1-yl diphosphate reductase
MLNGTWDSKRRGGGYHAMSRLDVREIPVAGVGLKRGEVLVPRQIHDPVNGPLNCPAAPLVAGSLMAKGRPNRVATLPRADWRGDEDARLFLVTCPREDGGTAAIAAAAPSGDALSASAARGAVEEWAAVSGSRSLLMASNPWCSGALHAASTARQAASDGRATGRHVYVFAPAAMPAETAAELDDLGAIVATSLDGVEPGDVVVFPAHGVTAEVRTEAISRGTTVVDATCPMVSAAQAAAARAADRGHQLVLVGPPDHAATEPIISQAPGRVTIVESAANTAAVAASDSRPISYLVQPGLTVEAGAPIVSALRSRYPAARGAVPGEVCYAPSDRAGTVYSVALGSDLMLVVGDPKSADTRQVSGHARNSGTRVQVIGEVSDIKPAMLASVHTIGLAESTSAAPGLAAQVLAALSGLGRLTVARRRLSTEKTADILG